VAKKPHKFADNRVEIATLLSEADLRAITARAAVESTGDLWNGMQRVVETTQSDGVIVFVIKDALTGWSKLMTFFVEFGFTNHKSTLSTEISTYMTTRPTVYGIPAGPSKMVAHHTYVQFITKIAKTVHLADSAANITLIDGKSLMPPPPAAPAGVLPSQAAAAPAAPWAVAPGEAQPAPAASELEAEHVEVGEDVAPPQPIAPVPIGLGGAAAVAPAEAAMLIAPEAPNVSTSTIDDSTHVVSRQPRGKPTWFLRPDELERMRVQSSISIGRDPRGSGDADDVLLAVPPTEWTVSKTHARVHVSGSDMYVTDLDSTNGTFLIDENENMVQCEPNVATLVPFGSGLELGAYGIAIDREAGVRT
jgi:hypothetical protein